MNKLCDYTAKIEPIKMMTDAKPIMEIVLPPPYDKVSKDWQGRLVALHCSLIRDRKSLILKNGISILKKILLLYVDVKKSFLLKI